MRQFPSRNTTPRHICLRALMRTRNKLGVRSLRHQYCPELRRDRPKFGFAVRGKHATANASANGWMSMGLGRVEKYVEQWSVPHTHLNDTNVSRQNRRAN